MAVGAALLPTRVYVGPDQDVGIVRHGIDDRDGLVARLFDRLPLFRTEKHHENSPRLSTSPLGILPSSSRARVVARREMGFEHRADYDLRSRIASMRLMDSCGSGRHDQSVSVGILGAA